MAGGADFPSAASCASLGFGNVDSGYTQAAASAIGSDVTGTRRILLPQLNGCGTKVRPDVADLLLHERDVCLNTVAY